jgi:hypothetical protein
VRNDAKPQFLDEPTRRHGSVRRVGKSLSLYEVGDGAAWVYTRYSRVHNGRQTFYGLREEDLRSLQGRPSIICFLWNGQHEPLMVPFAEYEDVFQTTAAARDGQYKVQVYLQDEGARLYIAKAGRFSAEKYFGWDILDRFVDSSAPEAVPELTHSQVQTLLGAIGDSKSYDIWIPSGDRGRMDWSLTKPYHFRETLPYGFETVRDILQEVDVIWIQRGSSELRALFEVEHSTPIYSGLLRFNDIHLQAPAFRPTFSIVANEERRSLFARQVNRPTFRSSGLGDLCTFLEYSDVFAWHGRTVPKQVQAEGNMGGNSRRTPQTDGQP